MPPPRTATCRFGRRRRRRRALEARALEPALGRLGGGGDPADAATEDGHLSLRAPAPPAPGGGGLRHASQETRCPERRPLAKQLAAGPRPHAVALGSPKRAARPSSSRSSPTSNWSSSANAPASTGYSASGSHATGDTVNVANPNV